MKKNLLIKFAAAISGASVAAAGCALPAIADPASVTTFGHLSGFGSDTTMDVMDGIASAIGNAPDGKPYIASYKAVGGADAVTKSGSLAVPRANGSGAGRDLLRVALGQTGSASVAIAPNDLGAARAAVSPKTEDVAGLVDFARSSSGPSGAVNDGVLTYIPFAIDAMTYATAPNSKIPNNLPVGSSANTSEASLYNIYWGNLDYVVTSDADGSFVRLQKGNSVSVGETAHLIKAYIPQAGSGTRSFWIGKFGITETNITNNATAAIATYGDNLSVQEHDGSALVNDPYALVGFSISQWVAQTNGVAVNRLKGAVLNNMTVSSTQQTPTSTTVEGGKTVYATNASWTAITRTVYNIVPTALANAAGDNYVKTVFVGDDSLVCQAKSAIQLFGYGLLSYPDTDASKAGTVPGSKSTVCGSIVAENRVSAPAATTVALGTPATNAAGEMVVTATVTGNNGKQGGSVTLYTDYGVLGTEAEVATATLAKGSNTVDIVVPKPASASSLSVVAEFLPNLSGLASSSSAATSVDFAKQTSTEISDVVYNTTGTTAAVTVSVSKPALAAGSVELYNGDVLVESKDIAAGASTVVFNLADTLNQASHDYSLTAKYVATSDASTGSETTEATAVNIKGTAAITATFTYTSGKVSSKKNTSQILTLSVKDGKALDAAAANGHAVVVISKGSAIYYATGRVVNGSASINLGKFKSAGKFTVKVYFSGDDFAASSKSLSFKLS